MKILFIGSRLFDDVVFYLKENGIESILTESNPNAPNIDLADKFFIVSRGMDEPIDIAKQCDVDGIIPLIGIDDPLMDVAIGKEKVENDLKILFISSNTNVINISSDKIKTKQFFQNNGFETPKFQRITILNFTNLNNSTNSIKIDLPAVLKQRNGQGGKDIKIVENIDEVKEYLLEFEEALFEEFIEGSELSIEVLGFKGEYIPLVLVYKGETTLEGIHPLNKVRSAPAEIEGLDNDHVKNIAYKIAKTLNAEGTIDIDFIFSKNDKKLYVLEINSRPSGTRYLTAAASGIHPLNKLVDMVSGKFDLTSIQKEIKDYFAIEIPVGNYEGPINAKPLKKFIKNSWVVHGPPNYERITISGESKNKTKKLAKKLLKDKFDDFNLENI